jgi:hypothetical protein
MICVICGKSCSGFYYRKNQGPICYEHTKMAKRIRAREKKERMLRG